MYPLCTRPLVCMLLGFELMHLPPNVALFALEDNQSSAKALEPTVFFVLHTLKGCLDRTAPRAGRRPSSESQMCVGPRRWW